jgi:KaiC/GvpD/RAD55 family RecA-like ATPase
MKDFNFDAEKAQTSSDLSFVSKRSNISEENLRTATEEQILPLDGLQADVSKSQNKDRVVYNAVELMALGSIEPKYLMEPFFPQKGTAVLAGKPDTGKSQFARQLCIQVALGEEKFLGFNLSPVHNRAIYVATEDNQEATTFLVGKQFKGLDKEAVENLRFIFADTMNQEEILKKLNAELKLCPADLVVVDSFGDVFKGGDSNNNMAMRNTVKLFDKIAKKHNCLILFVHHINKAAYKQAPGQEHIQGGSGLLQKVRLAIQLSEGENGIRYFSVVKGNYCPKEFKQNSLILNFSEETFLFTSTGKTKPTNEIGMQINKTNKNEKHEELQELANTILSDKLVSHGDFVKQFCEITDKSEPTAKRAIRDLVKSGFIEKYENKYRLKNIADEGDREGIDEEVENKNDDEIPS